MKSLVSVIIPTLNESRNIENCLKSIRGQNYKNIEIIIVDNFSKDQTIAICTKFSIKCYLKGPERSSQRNYGAQKAKGEYLLFLDADMRLTKNIIVEGVNKINKGKYIIAFPELSIGHNYWEKSIALERNLYQHEPYLSAARLFPKKLFAQIHGYDEKLIAGEDWDITLRAERLGYKLIFTDSFLTHRENIKDLKAILVKKAYYSRNISNYAAKHPLEFSKQSNIIYRSEIFLKNWKTLLKNPHFAIGFLIIKILTWHKYQQKKF